MASVNKVILVGNLGHYESMYLRYEHHLTNYKQPNGRERTPTLSISDDMPESGGGCAAAGVTDGPDVAASDDDEGGEGDGDPDRQSRKALRTRNPKVGANRRSSSTNKGRDGAVNQMTSNPRAHAQPNATTPAGALPSPQNPHIALSRLCFAAARHQPCGQVCPSAPPVGAPSARTHLGCAVSYRLGR